MPHETATEFGKAAKSAAAQGALGHKGRYLWKL
jgi:hypothetical protein